jgi:Protein of unknown function (DUF3515)
VPGGAPLTDNVGLFGRLLCGLAVAASATACGWGSVEVGSYKLEPETESTCQSLVDGLPDVVGDAVARDVSPDEGTTAAWGDPAIVLRCGVAQPPEYRPDAQVYEVDGVVWLPVEGKGGYFFTTIGRLANIEVAVPDEYAPEAHILTDLAEVIRDNVPEATASADPSGEQAPYAIGD